MARTDRFAWMDATPTSVMMAVDFGANGGDVRDERLRRVYAKVIIAFESAAEDEGLNHAWSLGCRTSPPASFDRRLAKHGLVAQRMPSQTRSEQDER